MSIVGAAVNSSVVKALSSSVTVDHMVLVLTVTVLTPADPTPGMTEAVCLRGVFVRWISYSAMPRVDALHTDTYKRTYDDL